MMLLKSNEFTMSMLRNKRIYIFALSIWGLIPAFAQADLGASFQKRILPEVKVRKSGPYFGVQKGKYLNGEIGMEHQWKTLKLVKPITQAVHFGITYNLKQNVMGYEAGYWCKVGRFNLTYGINALFLTDFNYQRFAFTPVIGYKFMGFHAQTGCNIMAPSTQFKNVNTFFISLRFLLINNRDWDIKK